MATEGEITQFRAYFGKVFADTEMYSDDLIGIQLDEAKVEVHQCVFKRYFRRAWFYLTAHFLILFNEQQLAMEGDSSGASASQPKGTISSASVGDLSLTQEMPEYSSSSDDRFLASTIYGQEFIRLRNKMSRGSLLANVAIPKTFWGCLCER